MTVIPDLKTLYEIDDSLWLEETIELLKAKKFDALDLDNLIDTLQENADAAGLSPDEKTKLKQFLTDKDTINEYNELINKLQYRIYIDPKQTADEFGDKPEGIILAAGANISAQKGSVTTQINNELTRIGFNRLDVKSMMIDSANGRIHEIEEKIAGLHGKHFRSMLVFYNYIKAKTLPAASDLKSAAIATFFNKFYEDSKLANENLEPFSSIRDKTVENFSFGVDLIFWTLFRITKYYFSGMHANFIKKMTAEIGPQNAEIRKLTLNIGLKEGKLKHICDLVAKTGGIPVERIIPDRAAYYITDDASMNVGIYTI